MVCLPDRKHSAGTPIHTPSLFTRLTRTDNLQLALALARLFQGAPGERDGSFHLADKQALTSVLTFLFGAFLGRIGDKMGAKSRAWLALGTFIQALFTMAAALCIWKSGQPSFADARDTPAWSNALSYVCIGFMSASMGLQGIMGKRVNTQFATTSASSSPLLSHMSYCINVWRSRADDRVV